MQSENSFSMDSQATFSMPSEAEDPLRPGVTFDGFELTERLGRGGLGEVWKAYRADEKRFVALKFVPRDLLLYEEELLRVEGTFRKIESLHHENICPLYGMRRHPELGPYLVFRFLDGLTLNLLFIQKFLNCGKTMPLKLAVSILRPVAEALDYAHGKGLIHRDVKPGNIMLEMGRLKDGSLDFSRIRSVQLIDFGQAAFRSGLSRISMSEGTPPPPGTSGTVPFMSPEQFQGKPQDAQCDQYALAVTAYELLAGHLPFVSDDPQILTNCILNVQPDPIDDLPDSANAALLRALAKDPAQRFLTCQEFIRALDEEPSEIKNEGEDNRKEGKKHLGGMDAEKETACTSENHWKVSVSLGKVETEISEMPDPDTLPETLISIQRTYTNELAKLKTIHQNYGPQSPQAEQTVQDIREAGAAVCRQVRQMLESAQRRHQELLDSGMLKTAPDVKKVSAMIVTLERFMESFTESEITLHLEGYPIVIGGRKERIETNGCAFGCGIFALFLGAVWASCGIRDIGFVGFVLMFVLVGWGGAMVMDSIKTHRRLKKIAAETETSEKN